jgi:hypothetical protein
MNPAIGVNPKLVRLSIALVWMYQGLWCKLLAGAPHHLAVVSAVPFFSPVAAHAVLMALGLLECGIAVWVLSARQLRRAAIVQTVLLAGMNAAGLIWARGLIPDPAGMVLQNFAFVILIWIAAEDRPHVANA